MTGPLSMRPTRRGIVLFGLVCTGIYMAAEFGPRALNAVVAPALVALVAAGLQVVLADPPTVTRQVPQPGAVGTERSVELVIETGSPTSATIQDGVGEGLLATGNHTATTIGAGPISYAVELAERGEHDLGPLDVTITDVLGLFTRRFRFEDVDPVLVYPAVYRLDPAGSGLSVFADVERSYGADEFEHLREYQRGDRLRDVNWKASARRPDEELVVDEYVENRTQRTVRIVVDASVGDVDDLARAAASVAVHLLDDGVSVGLTTATATIEPDTGRPHRRAILASLARLSAASPPDESRSGADMVISSTGSGVTVRMDGVQVPFDELVADRNGDLIEGEDIVPDPTAGDSADTGEVVV